MRRCIDDPVVNEEIGRLIGLAAVDGGVDAEVGEKTIFGRDARQHQRKVAFAARPPHRFMRRESEHARMAVERGDRPLAGAHASHHLLDHGLVALRPLDTLAVVAVQ